jgi:hypothetical protein
VTPTVTSGDGDGNGPPSERRCAQCRGPTDGREQQVAIGDLELIWLHPGRCEQFYLQALKDQEDARMFWRR